MDSKFNFRSARHYQIPHTVLSIRYLPCKLSSRALGLQSFIARLCARITYSFVREHIADKVVVLSWLVCVVSPMRPWRQPRTPPQHAHARTRTRQLSLLAGNQLPSVVVYPSNILKGRTNIPCRSVLLIIWGVSTFHVQRVLSILLFVPNSLLTSFGLPFTRAWGGLLRPKIFALHSNPCRSPISSCVVSWWLLNDP